MIEFAALNVSVGFQMYFALGSGNMVGWLLNSSWLMYAAMGVVTFCSDDTTAETPAAEQKAVMLDLKEVEERLERIQARLDRVKGAAKKTG